MIEAKNKLRDINRKELLKYKIKKPDIDNLILVQIYQNKFAKNNRLRNLVKDLWQKLIIKYPYFRTVWPKPPILAYKNSKSIRNFITSSKFPAPWHADKQTDKQYKNIDELNLDCLISLMGEA